ADRQRHRLLVYLWCQPANDTLHGQRARSWASVVQLTVRGQRRVRLWNEARVGRTARPGRDAVGGAPGGARRRSRGLAAAALRTTSCRDRSSAPGRGRAARATRGPQERRGAALAAIGGALGR